MKKMSNDFCLFLNCFLLIYILSESKILVKERIKMNYYQIIKEKLIDNEIYCKVKDYSKEI